MSCWQELALTIGGALWMFAYFSKTITKRLQVMSTMVSDFASQIPLNEQDSGFDEIAEVDKTFHWMARRIDESARRERAMTENAVDVICSITDDGNFREVNSAALNLWGYTPEELLGQRYISLVRESDREKNICSFARSAREQVASGIRECNQAQEQFLCRGSLRRHLV